MEASDSQVSRLVALVHRHKQGDELAGRAIGEAVLLARVGSSRPGKNWVCDVAHWVGMCKSALYARERLARCWSPAEYECLLRRRGPFGAHLFEAHLLVVAQVTVAVERAALIERVLNEGLGVRELKAIVYATTLARRSKRRDPAHEGWKAHGVSREQPTT